MTDENKEACCYILDYYGEVHQQEKAIEEMAELITAIKHGDRENYVEELADVSIMIEQLFQALSFEEQQKFIVTIHSKISRQIDRIHKETAADEMKEGVFTLQEQMTIQETQRKYMREYMREYMKEYRKTHPPKKRPYKPVPTEKKREYQNRYWLKKAKKMLDERAAEMPLPEPPDVEQED